MSIWTGVLMYTVCATACAILLPNDGQKHPTARWLCASTFLFAALMLARWMPK